MIAPQRVPLAFRAAARLFTAALLFGVASCVAGTGDLGDPYPTLIQVRAIFPAGFSESASGLVIDRVRVQAIRAPDQLLAEAEALRDPNQTEIPLELSVDLESEQEMLILRVLMYSGQRLVLEGERESLVEGSKVNQSPDISLEYVAGGVVVSLEVVPEDSVLTFGESLTFRALAYDANGNSVPDFYVSWESSNPAAAIDALGRIQAPPARSRAVITAKIFEGPRAVAPIRFVPPPASVQPGQPGSQQPGPGTLTARVLGADGLGVPFVRVEFVAITPGGFVATPVVWTDEGGFASTQASPGSVPGDYDFEARVEGLDPALFTLTSQLSSITLTVSGAGAGDGTVRSTPAGLICTISGGSASGSCSSAFAPGTTVSLSASPAAGSTFGGWSGAGCSGTGVCQVALNQAETVTATFNQIPPAIVLSQTSVAFTGSVGAQNPPTQAVTVTNAGGGTLSGLSIGSISYGPGASGWLLTPSVNPATAPATITLGVDLAGLGTGAYTATVPVQSAVASNSPQSISVTLDVTAQPQFLLTVIGAGAGDGTVTSAPSGINCSIASGSGSGTCATPFDQGTLVTLTAVESSGSTFTGWSGASCSGTGTCQVTMDQAHTVTATFDVMPDLAVTPQSAAFSAVAGGPNPSNQILSVTNAGGGSVGTLSLGSIGYSGASSGWLVPNLGASATPTSLTLSVDVTGLPVGASSATFDVVSTNGGNETVSVSLNVTAQPQFLLTVNGAGAGDGTVTSAPAGISCTISGGAGSGTCAAPFDLGTLVTLTAIESGGSTFTGWSGAGCSGTGICQVTMNQAETVTATFDQAPDLVVNPLTANFSLTQGPTQDQQILAVTNGGGGSLGTLSLGAVSYGSGAGWLSPVLQVAVPNDMVLVNVDITGLAPGQYSATFDVISTNGGNETVTVNVDVQAPSPVIGFSQASTTFNSPQGGVPTPNMEETQVVWVKNTGGGTLTWSASSGAGWLEISPTGGSVAAGDSMALSLTKDSISAAMVTGVYPTNVTVTAVGASNSPANYPVTLDIGAGPPAVSTNIQVTGVSNTAVSISWQNNHSGAGGTYLQVERWDPWNSWHIAATSLPAGTTTYMDNTFVSGTRVQYRVRTCDTNYGSGDFTTNLTPPGCPNQALQPHPATWPARNAEGTIRDNATFREPGVTVYLRRCQTSAGVTQPPSAGVCATYDGGFSEQNLVSDGQGQFQFTYLPPGVYEVRVDPASAGFTSVSLTQGGAALPAASVLYDLVGNQGTQKCQPKSCVNQTFYVN